MCFLYANNLDLLLVNLVDILHWRRKTTFICSEWNCILYLQAIPYNRILLFWSLLKIWSVCWRFYGTHFTGCWNNSCTTTWRNVCCHDFHSRWSICIYPITWDDSPGRYLRKSTSILCLGKGKFLVQGWEW